MLLPGKNNLAPECNGLAFPIIGKPAAIVWECDPVAMSADDALAERLGMADDQNLPTWPGSPARLGAMTEALRITTAGA